MMPDLATLYIAGASSEALGTAFWQDVYGFSMVPVATSILQNSQGKAVVTEVPSSSVLTEAVALRTFDLVTMQKEETDFSLEFCLPLLEKVSSPDP